MTDPRWDEIEAALNCPDYTQETPEIVDRGLKSLARLRAERERMREALEDVEQQFHAFEIRDQISGYPCPRYKAASIYLDITKTRAALAAKEE